MSRRLLIATTAMLAMLALLLAAAAQLSAQRPAADAGAPLYEIELIVFAHRDLDRGEELFEPRQRAGAQARPMPQARERTRFDDALDALQSVAPGDPTDTADTPADPLTPGIDGQPGSPPDPASANAPADADDASWLRFGFRLLRAEELQLGGTYAALERLQAYTPLLHGGWIQEARPEREARPFDLAYLGRSNPRGTVQLHLSLFPHLKVDLSYQSSPVSSPAPSPASDSIGDVRREPFALGEIELAPRYNLVEERRIPPGQLHYLDHPAFGVIIVIREHERETQTDETPRPAA